MLRGSGVPDSKTEVGAGKGVRNVLPERPQGCFAQNVPDPFSGPRRDLEPVTKSLDRTRGEPRDDFQLAITGL